MSAADGRQARRSRYPSRATDETKGPGIDKLGFLSCFFPAWNEQAAIGQLIEEAVQTLPRFAEAFEVIVVDDGSSDSTAAVVRACAERYPQVRLEQHPSNLGYGHALRTGLHAARGDVVFFTDADQQFRIADIERLLPAFVQADVVAGYRIKRNDPWHRLIVAWVYHKVLRVTFGLGLRDVDCAFKLISRAVMDDVVKHLESRSAFISPELIIRSQRAGYRVVEAAVPHYPRTSGRPKGASVKVIARTVTEIVRMRRTLGGSRRPPASTQ